VKNASTRVLRRGIHEQNSTVRVSRTTRIGSYAGRRRQRRNEYTLTALIHAYPHRFTTHGVPAPFFFSPRFFRVNPFDIRTVRESAAASSHAGVGSRSRVGKSSGLTRQAPARPGDGGWLTVLAVVGAVHLYRLDSATAPSRTAAPFRTAAAAVAARPFRELPEIQLVALPYRPAAPVSHLVAPLFRLAAPTRTVSDMFLVNTTCSCCQPRFRWDGRFGRHHGWDSCDMDPASARTRREDVRLPRSIQRLV
jgi:hypothetical protein